MSRAFRIFLDELAVSNRAQISTSYEEITKKLNQWFWEKDSTTEHSLRVGSFGRRTAIHGISDLDMVFELPRDYLLRYQARAGNGPSAMLQDVRSALEDRYTRTSIRGDGPVVVVEFEKYVVEVLPAFLEADGSYIYGLTRDGGSWDVTRPRAEMDAFDSYDSGSGGVIRDIAKMLRAWKNRMGAPIGGYLIDTLSVNFLQTYPEFSDTDIADYGVMVERLFEWLQQLDSNDEWPAPGSGNPVKAKGSFTGRARKAWRKCQEASAAQSLVERTKRWRSVFGLAFPVMERGVLQDVVIRDLSAPGEEFIEKRMPVDVRYRVKLDYEVSQNKVKNWDLMRMPRRNRRLPHAHTLRFFLKECNVPEPFSVLWKVKNRGSQAAGRERGEISSDGGQRSKTEVTNFDGSHYVEVYITKNNVCVARDRADVPIGDR